MNVIQTLTFLVSCWNETGLNSRVLSGFLSELVTTKSRVSSAPALFLHFYVRDLYRAILYYRSRKTLSRSHWPIIYTDCPDFRGNNLIVYKKKYIAIV